MTETTDRLQLGKALQTLLPDQWPKPADFPAPPTSADRERWADADRAARPERLGRLRERMGREGADAETLQAVAHGIALPDYPALRAASTGG